MGLSSSSSRLTVRRCVLVGHQAYLDKVYLQNLDNFVLLVEEFENATIDDHRNVSGRRRRGRGL